jgi:hypothetical protein
MQHISENLFKACPNQDIKDLFKWTTSKKKPRQFKQCMLSIKQPFLNGYKFSLTVGTIVDQNGKKKINLSRWAQCKDKSYRWGL